jgi:hypothetical protein
MFGKKIVENKHMETIKVDIHHFFLKRLRIKQRK